MRIVTGGAAERFVRSHEAPEAPVAHAVFSSDSNLAEEPWTARNHRAKVGS
jgi:hypothetical protein